MFRHISKADIAEFSNEIRNKINQTNFNCLLDWKYFKQEIYQFTEISRVKNGKLY